MKEKSYVRINANFSTETNAWLEEKSEKMAIPKSTLITIAVETWRRGNDFEKDAAR